MHWNGGVTNRTRDDARDEELVVVDGAAALGIWVDLDGLVLLPGVVVGARTNFPDGLDGLGGGEAGIFEWGAGGLDGFEVAL